MADFDLQGALRAGWSKTEVADHLAKQSNFDAAGARSAGWDDDSIIGELQRRFASSTERTWGEAASDLGTAAVKGAVNLGRSVASLSPAAVLAEANKRVLGTAGIEAPGAEVVNRPAGQQFEQAGDVLESAKSPGLKNLEQQTNAQAEKTGAEFRELLGDQYGETAQRWGGVVAEAASKFKNTITSPQLMAQTLAENAPSMLPSAAAARATQGAAAELLPQIMRRTTQEAVENAARTAGIAGGIVTGAAQQGSEVANDTFQRMMAMDEATWSQDETYRLLKRDIGARAAKERIAGEAATTAGVKGGLASLAINGGLAKVGGAAIESAALKGEGRRIAQQGAVKAVAKDTAGEAATEALEEGYGQYAQNVGAQTIDRSVNTLQGVGSAAGAAAAAGAGMGGGATGVRAGMEALSRQRVDAENKLAAAQSVDEAIVAANELSGDLGDMTATVDNVRRAVDAYLGTPQIPQMGEPSASPEAPGLDAAGVPSTAAGDVVAPSVPQQPAVLPAGQLQQVQQTIDRDVASLQSEAASLAQAATAGTQFERDNATAQAAAAREAVAPPAAAGPELLNRVPIEPKDVKRALAAARVQEELDGGNPAQIAAISDPRKPGTFALRRLPLPEAAPAPRRPRTAAPFEQQRLEQAAVEGDFANAQPDLQRQLDQQGFRRAQQAVEARGGVATPEEAALLDRASPGERLYDSVQGQPTAAPRPAAQATMQQDAAAQAAAKRLGLEVPQQPRARREAPAPQAEPAQVQVERAANQKPGAMERQELPRPAPAPEVPDTRANPFADQRLEMAAAAAPRPASETIERVPAFVNTMRRTNTPAARMFVRQYDAGQITDAEVEQAMAVQDEVAGRIRMAEDQRTPEAGGVQAAELRRRGASPVLAAAMARYGNRPRTEIQERLDAAREQRENPKRKQPTSAPPAETGPTPDERLARAAEQAAPAQDEATSRLEQAAAAAPQREGLITIANPRFSTQRGEQTLEFTLDGEPQTVQLVDNKQLGTHGMLMRQIARIFGKRVQAFTGAPVDGFTWNDRDTIYLNAESQMSPLSVFGHELSHLLEQDHPAIYRAIKAAVAKGLTSEQRAAFRRDYGKTANVDELTSDLVGNALADSAFWPTLFEQLGVAKVPVSAVRSMVDAVTDALNKVLRLVRQPAFKADKIVGDRLVEIRDAIRTGMTQYAAARYEAAQAMDRQDNADRYARDESGRFATKEDAVNTPTREERQRDAGAAARREMGMRFSPVRNNASGESAASLEAQSRIADEKRRGLDRVLVTRSGEVRPLFGVDSVDQRVRSGQVMLQRGVGRDEWSVLDRAPDVKAGEVERAKLAAARWREQQQATETPAETAPEDIPTGEATELDPDELGDIQFSRRRNLDPELGLEGDISDMTAFDPAAESGEPGAARASAQRNNFGTLTAEQQAALANVGGVTTEQTLGQRFKELRQNFAKRAVQGALDQFAPIRELDENAYMLARMSKAYDGTLEATLLYGKPFLRDGVPDVDVADNGFAKVLADLQGEGDRFLWWVSAQRAERLKSLGLENLFSEQDISSLKTLNEGDMPDGSSRTKAYAKALAEFNSFNDAVLAMAEQSGLIDAQARQMYKDVPYVPFYRVLEEGGVQGPTFSSGLTNAKAWKKLKGGSQKLNNDLLANVLLNWSSLYQSSARNRAALATMDAAVKVDAAEKVPSGTKKSVQIMRNGKTEHYLVEDPQLMEAISAMEYVVPKFLRPLSTVKRWLTIGVTANPAYKIRNVIRDTISAIAQADLSYNPVKNFAQGYKATDKRGQTYASMIASGGAIRFGAALEGNDATRARQLVAREAGLPEVLDQKSWKKMAGMLGSMWDAYQEVGDKLETVNRAALYEQLRANGKSHAEAAFMARDLLDFSMQGQWPVIRFLAATVPFLNTRLQGLYKLGRAGMENPKRMGYVAGAVMLASIGLMLAYKDDEDWKKRGDEDRDSSWWFKIGDTAVRIPKPFELGVMGTMAERAVEMFAADDMTGKRFAASLSRAIFQTFAFDPTPQVAKPLLDIYANRDSFSGRQIETEGDQRLRPEDRFDERTTTPARILGQLGLPDPAQLVKGRYAPLSPKQIDFLARGYFGWAGATTLAALDYGMRPAMDRGERPDIKLRDAFLAGSFVESLPANQSRYLNQLYEEARVAEQAYASLRAAAREGDKDAVERIREEEKGDLTVRKALAKGTKRIGEINREIRQIEASRTLSGETKRMMIDRLSQRRNELAERVVERTREVRERVTK